MKRSTFITIISLLIPLLGISQTKATYIDDIYAKPSEAKAQVSNQSTNTRPTPNYKNGAKEIVYIERESPNTKIVHDTVYVEGQANEVRRNASSNIIHGIIHDTIYLSGPASDSRENSTITQDTPIVLGEANDSTENNQEQGYYLNGFKGSQSDLEYAERIRRFHNPKYEIFVGDPRYNDIYFLNDNDWNVYIDGSYAYVTPTWTNPTWWNYNSSPYGYYGGYGWNYPWGYNNFYGGFGFGFGGYYDDYFGFGGYYGYGYPYYGYGYPYYGYGYGSLGGEKRHEDADQRLRSGISSREGGYLYNSSSKTATRSLSGTSNQYTAISGSNNVSSRSRNLNTTSRSVSSGIGLIRAGFASRSLTRGLNSSSYTTYTRSGISAINTRPRTTNYNSSNYLSRSINSNSGSSTVRSVNSSRSFYSGTNSTYYPSSSSSVSSRSSSPSYSSGSSTSSGSSYSGGGSSSSGGGGGSRSSGGGGGRR